MDKTPEELAEIQNLPVAELVERLDGLTAADLSALRAHGPCPQHRRSFAPVRAALAAVPVQAELPGLPQPA